MDKHKKDSEYSRYTYADSGVDLDSAAKAVDLIKKSVSSTFNKNVLNDLTSYAGLFSFDAKNYKNPVLVSSTDGVGTKLLVAKETGLYGTIGQDLVAMCVNDILCCGAKPLFFLDYIACGKLVPEKISMIVSSIAASCKACKTALIGGETAEMPEMYAEDDIDLAGFVVGVVDKNVIINPGLVKEGDSVLGVLSSGVHSNGFSLIRKIVRDKRLDLNKVYDGVYDSVYGRTYSRTHGSVNEIDEGKSSAKKTLGALLMEPTKLYFRLIHDLTENMVKLNGVAHITGGGFYENINRVIPGWLDVVIDSKSWPVPGIFSFLENIAGIEKEEMFRVFNMGIGMVLISGAEQTGKIISIAKRAGENIYRIGSVVKGSGKVLVEFH